jgi:hypothetical protein
VAVDTDFDFVTEVGDMIEHFMILRGQPPDDCVALSNAVKAQIRFMYKGDRVRIRSGRPACVTHAQIKANFDGTNIKEIMERYGVSRSTVYRIVGSRE